MQIQKCIDATLFFSSLVTRNDYRPSSYRRERAVLIFISCYDVTIYDVVILCCAESRAKVRIAGMETMVTRS
jgi:hypothetical protein